MLGSRPLSRTTAFAPRRDLKREKPFHQERPALFVASPNHNPKLPILSISYLSRFPHLPLSPPPVPLSPPAFPTFPGEDRSDVGWAGQFNNTDLSRFPAPLSRFPAPNTDLSRFPARSPQYGPVPLSRSQYGPVPLSRSPPLLCPAFPLLSRFPARFPASVPLLSRFCPAFPLPKLPILSISYPSRFPPLQSRSA